MEAVSVCLFNKYGHCKFREKCRHKHYDEICVKVNCDISQCIQRHPKQCKYFDAYLRCKFGDFCSYLHKPSQDKTDLSNELSTIESTVMHLEDVLKVKDDEILCLKSRIEVVEQQLRNVLENVQKMTEITVQKTTDIIVKSLNDRQDLKEKQMELQFNALSEQLAMLVEVMKPSNVSNPTSPNSFTNLESGTRQKQTTGSAKYCRSCKKSFSSKQALKDHLATNHLQSC